jgi:Zn-dependent protease with chaperone function
VITFRAVCFDGVTTKPREVLVSFDGALLRVSGSEMPERAMPGEVVIIQPPLGGIRRTLLLPGGVRCETEDMLSVRRLEHLLGKNRPMRIVHLLENRWRTVLACFAILAACVWGFSVHAIPLIAQTAAASLPHTVTENLSRKTLELLDSRYMQPSGLSDERQAFLVGRFEQELQGVETPFPCRVLFRMSQILGPNALALPDGTIVFTDELVELAREDTELVGVLMHEVAHVKHRHAMRSLLQNTGVVMLVSVLLGDAVSVTSTAAALPALLLELGYSREFEREADRTAGNYLLEKGYGTSPLQAIFERMVEKSGRDPGLNLLSTHPGMQERIELLKRLETEWQNSGATIRRMRPERLAAIPGLTV